MKKILITIFSFISLKSNSQITSDSLLNSFVKDWLNVPYKFGGKTKKGIDCSKLTQRVYKDVYNLEIPGVSWKQWDISKRISKDSLQTGDLVFFNSRLSPSGWHVGLYLIDGYFFHASNRKDDVKISNLNEKVYLENYKGAGRLENELILK